MGREVKINFNPDLFNNVYWHLEDAFLNEKIRYVWLYGGSSASKTYSAVQLTIKLMLGSKDENTMVLRKIASDIRDSIYSDFKSIISEWNLGEYFEVQQNYIRCVTGSYVRFRGLDDSEKIKGLTNFKRVILEEISKFDEVDLKQIRKRLRGKKGQQIVGIFNPISEEHWIKTNVFDKEILIEEKTDISGKWKNQKGNTVILKTTYLDNKYIVGPHFVDQHCIDDFEKDRLTDFAYYQVYGLGNWGKLRTGGEFWKDFNANRDIIPNPIIKGYPKLYRPDLPIHISWDKNVNPYLPCSLWQTETKDGKKKVWQFDEIALADPLNRVRHACAEICKRYPKGEEGPKLFIYGDRTAIQEDTTKEKGENFFTDIMKGLSVYRPQLRVPTSNPSVNQSADFVNEIYARNYGSIEIRIGDNCKKAIYDYNYTLEDENGGVAKTTKRNPLTKVTYQEFGHFSDAKRYVLTMLFAEQYANYRRGDKGQKITVGKNDSRHSF